MLRKNLFNLYPNNDRPFPKLKHRLRMIFYPEYRRFFRETEQKIEMEFIKALKEMNMYSILSKEVPYNFKIGAMDVLEE